MAPKSEQARGGESAEEDSRLSCRDEAAGKEKNRSIRARVLPEKSDNSPRKRAAKPKPKSLQSYIPPYLRSYVFPYHGDFCYTPHVHVSIVAQLMMEGFLPIATPQVVLPKLHQQRCVITLQKRSHTCEQNVATAASAASNKNKNCICNDRSISSSDLHVTKQVRKKSKRYALTCQQDFDAVVTACREQHGDHCWLYPGLVNAFRQMHDATSQRESTNSVANNNSEDLQTASSSYETGFYRTITSDRELVKLRMYSVEVWNEETGELAAGELGYAVGSVFTSLTGFSREPSAGSIQLCALGTLLTSSGFTVWDLGMEMDYKKALGSTLMPRDEFVQTVRSARLEDVPLWPANASKRNCRAILDQSR